MRTQARRRVAPDLEVLVEAEATARRIGPRPLPDPQVLLTIRAALKAPSALRFNYGPGPEPGRLRTATPWGLLYGRSYYMVGQEAGKKDPVLWRLDRMTSAHPGGAADRRPEGWMVGDFASRSLGVFQETPVNEELRFSRLVATDAKRFQFHPTQVMEPQEQNSKISGY